MPAQRARVRGTRAARSEPAPASGHFGRGITVEIFSGFFIFLWALVIIVLAIIARGVRAVPQGYNWTVERFGRYRITLQPGLRLINPFIDRIGRKVNVQETVLEIPAQNVITKDNASVVVDGIVFYQVIDASHAAYEVQNLQSAVINITMTNIRTAIGALDLDETLSKRDEINERLLRVLDAATEPWGTKITRVELKDVRPPEDVQISMAKQLTADRERRAAVLKAEGIKQAAILEAEGAKQAQILAAEGRLAAAQKDAEARERLAEAEAKATAYVSKAVSEGNVQALNYFIAQKYVEAMNQIGQSPNARLVLMPMETSGLVGTIAGIAELAKNAVTQPR
jgi:regulator of protease activity HflC (stomatin/prohibitin superfamily)